MRTSRIHVSETLASDTELVLPAAQSNYLLRVLRLRPGATLTLFNGAGGEFLAELLPAAGAARVRIGAHSAIERESPLRLTLLQGIARGERMDLIVQKATELGVTRIVPLATEHAVVRLDQRQAERRRAHWQAIAISACEQCGRNRLPEIAAVAEYSAACSSNAEGDTRLMLDPEAASPLATLASRISAATLLIGPEGGISDGERQLAIRYGFSACRLGPRILRTETAPLAALAVLQALAGDLGGR